MFPLLRLDRVSLDEVFRNMTPIELFNLSQCSKITLINVKDLARRINKQYFPMIIIEENCSVNVICYQKDNETTEWSLSVCGAEQLEFENGNQSKGVINGIQFTGVMLEDEQVMETYWENEDDGFKALTDYIEDLYGIPAKFYFESEDSQKLIRMIDWAKNRRQPINYGTIILDSVNDDDEIVNILDNLKSFEKLRLEMSPGEDFIKNDHRIYDFKNVSLSGRNWINLQRLLSMKCQQISAKQTILTNADINVFIKFWMKGLDFELERLRLEVNELNVLRILSDIPHSKVTTLATLYNGHLIPLVFNFRLSNGRNAMIFEVPPDVMSEENETFNLIIDVKP